MKITELFTEINDAKDGSLRKIFSRTRDFKSI